MQIEILTFIVNESGMKKGQIDFKVIHSADKWEIFRNVSYFQKDNKRWLSLPSTKRDDKWIAVYEREPGMKVIFDEVIKIIKDYSFEELKSKYIAKSQSAF
jgi:hypothetical protein